MIIAERLYDVDARVIHPLHQATKITVIPSNRNHNRNRKQPCDYDRHLYKARHLIEKFFAKFKQFRAFDTRYDKRARHFLVAIHLASALIWLN